MEAFSLPRSTSSHSRGLCFQQNIRAYARRMNPMVQRGGSAVLQPASRGQSKRMEVPTSFEIVVCAAHPGRVQQCTCRGRRRALGPRFRCHGGALPDADGICAATKFKYNIATAASGAWESAVYSSAYHSFVEYITGLPKMNANTLTAINHWQVVQRDVLEALGKSVAARTRGSIEALKMPYCITGSKTSTT